jgi:hypothetical protein
MVNKGNLPENFPSLLFLDTLFFALQQKHENISECQTKIPNDNIHKVVREDGACAN